MIDCNSIFERLNIDLANYNIGGFNEDYKQTMLPATLTQNTRVKVDEYGIVAASLSICLQGASLIEGIYPKLCFNRPFIYFVRNTVTGTVILMGQVTNPAE